ncbi:DNA polymerase III subunit gamma and tau [Nocardioides ganghwensis]|uniref:DNA polymerase III subunit gamma/tau n=1 Tax=Nocardioides ganghwensis TaxID=252230 RepID=A0A4Q2SCW1_9ACTN|nr:DNA polymerase III subunit gamma and tau [Nocardioides ganghwensis]MBD3946376.1 DNA polymerase III subunit gamma and tau [Nocardioides ganghwensis]RYC03135.1 DNA polymerase III subunit gamma and tau [Nocardioides ganghwensis]
MESPLALYRRYRPETFQEVIGQDHVTEPLRAALAANRVNHAYLFSGPRGCGKTTSARILARALNCAQAPISDPCGECDSCRDLARGGPGSIDVIEIDAASHGGVDDARDLREKAFFAPVRDRYKVYIIDEAHMVTTQGFNALLKLVEEPPPHLRFIFATTEPDKVLPTIRSRTHHYPFRLIPPRLLSDYLTQLAGEEGVAIESAALPLVVRAGAGSARDTLSVLDQLLGGAGPAGVTHKLASDLLGFTPDSLLDEVIEAFATRDGAAVFSVVDKVVETGQDPRRFTEDLLRRLRDLVIVTAVPDAPATGLIDVSEDAGERLVAQAARFGAIELSRAADIVAAGLTEMRGATAPRLLLELLCARVLLPGADHTSDGVMARLERLERRMDVTAAPQAAEPRATAPRAAAPQAAPPPVEATAPAPVPVRDEPAPPPPMPSAPAGAPAAAQDGPPPPPPMPTGPPAQQAPAAHQPPPADPAPAAAAAGPDAPVAEQPAGPRGGLSLVDVRRLWPDILEQTKNRRRLAWMVLSQHAHVVDVDGKRLTVGFANAGARDSFVNGGCDEILRQAAIDVVGMDWRVESIVDPSGAAAEAPVVRQASTDAPTAPAPTAPPPETPDGPPAWVTGDAAVPTAEPAPPAAPPVSAAPAREALEAARAGGGPAEPAAPVHSPDDDADPDDPDAESAALDTESLLSQTLGAKLIEEIRND